MDLSAPVTDALRRPSCGWDDGGTMTHSSASELEYSVKLGNIVAQFLNE